MKIDFVITDSTKIPDLKIFTPNSFKEERGKFGLHIFQSQLKNFYQLS